MCFVLNNNIKYTKQKDSGKFVISDKKVESLTKSV